MAVYRIEIKGDGGEFIAGEVMKEFFDALEENGISIEDYAEGDEDDKQFECIPEEIRPFDPGGWYNINSIVHRNLCDSDRMELEVTDEDSETVYEGGEFRDNKHMTENDDDDEDIFSIYDPDRKYEGKCFYTCQRDENGVFFSGEIELDEPFDPEKLCLLTVRLNELDFISRVLYYPQGLDEDGFPIGDPIEIQDEGDHESEINGATHELMEL